MRIITTEHSDGYAKRRLEDEFFNDKFLMSYSALNKLIFSPASFYQHYVLKKREDSFDKSMLMGRIIHKLLLEPDKFDDDFLVNPKDLPGDTICKILNKLYSHHKELKKHDAGYETLEEYSDAIFDILKDEDLYQKMSDTLKLSRIITENTKMYWEFLKLSEKKTVIDDDLLIDSQLIVDKVKSNSHVSNIMGLIPQDKVEVFNEHTLIIYNTLYEFGFRGILDNLVIDHNTKTIRLNDVKTTSKTITDFKNSIDFYRYWIQGAMYKMLILNDFRLSKLINDDNYEFQFRFVVIDGTGQVGCIKISNDTLDKWLIDTKNEFDKANYHFKERNFELPYEFLINKEIEL